MEHEGVPDAESAKWVWRDTVKKTLEKAIRIYCGTPSFSKEAIAPSVLEVTGNAETCIAKVGVGATTSNVDQLMASMASMLETELRRTTEISLTTGRGNPHLVLKIYQDASLETPPERQPQQEPCRPADDARARPASSGMCSSALAAAVAIVVLAVLAASVSAIACSAFAPGESGAVDSIVSTFSERAETSLGYAASRMHSGSRAVYDALAAAYDAVFQARGRDKEIKFRRAEQQRMA